ncbi:MAG: hypothetical protein RL660_753 [Bacteroidota bacterium]|jgi:hypothetical protein
MRSFIEQSIKPEISIEVYDDYMVIDEFYNSGFTSMRDKRPAISHAQTELKIVQNEIQVCIDINRAFEPIFYTMIAALLNVLALLFSIVGTIYFLADIGYVEINLLAIYMFNLVLFGALLLIWSLSREKHISIMRDIDRILKSVNRGDKLASFGKIV